MAWLVAPKCSLTIEEIASNGIDGRDCAICADFVDPLRGSPSWDGTWP